MDKQTEDNREPGVMWGFMRVVLQKLHDPSYAQYDLGISGAQYILKSCWM